MATKTSDAILRIRAKNLSKKDLQGVAADLDAIAESQKRNVTAAGLAARSLRELNDEQRALKAVADDLTKRRGLIERIVGTPAEMKAAGDRVRALQKELAELQRMRSSGAFVGDIGKAIRTAEANLKRANREVENQKRGFDKALESARSLGMALDDMSGELNKVNAQAERTDGLMRDAEAAAEGYEAAIRDANDALSLQEQRQREITAEAERRNRIERDAAKQRRAEAAQRAAELREQARIREDLTKRFSATPLSSPFFAQPLGPAGDAGAREAARSAAFRERLVNVLARQKDAGERLIRTEQNEAQALDRSTRAVDRNTRSLDRNNNATGLFADTGRKSLSVYQRMRGQLLSLAAAYVGFHEAIRLVSGSFAVAQERVGIELQLRVANNDDIQAAEADIQFLKGTADRLGQVYEEIAKHYANYKIAARAVGAGNATIRESFTDAVEIITALRLPTETAGNVFRAFTQILGKNRVQAEELRNQLGDALPGAVSKFAQSLVDDGVIDSITDLETYFKKGEGTIQHFFNFLTDYAKTTEGQIEASSQTTLAGVRRLINTYRDFLVTFQESGADKTIGETVDAISKALKGAEGKKFAEDLAAAFGFLGRVVVGIIKHFDAFVALLKMFLALQIIKGVYGISGAVWGAVAAFGRGAKAVGAWTVALNTARIAGEKLTKVQRTIMLLTGPLGIAIAALAGAFYLLTNRISQSVERMEKFGQTVEAVANAKTTAELEIAQAGVNAELDASIAKVKELKQAAEDQRSFNLNTRREANDTLVSEGVLLPGDMERRVNEELTKQAGLRQTLVISQRKQVRLAQEEADAAAAAALDVDNFMLPEPGEDTGAGAKENKRLTAARAVQKELLQLDQDILSARLQGEDQTLAEVHSRYTLEIDRIAAMIAERELEIDKLEQAANAAGIGPDQREEISALRAKVQQLQASLNTVAMEENLTAEIAFHQRKINEEIELRDTRIAAINELVESGAKTEVEGLREITAERLRAAGVIGQTITTLTTFLSTIEDEALRKALGVDKILEDMALLQIQIRQTETTIDLVKKNLAGQLSQGIAAAMGTLAQGLAGAIRQTNSLKDAFKGAGDSFLNFIADFLIGIGQAIMQAILLEAILRAMGKGSGGSWTDVAVGALTRHRGGLVGRNTGNTRRSVSPLVFAGAERFHSGGLPGLRPNEVPIIAKKGEEVLNESDPRNVLNGGTMPQGGNVDLSIINTIDPTEMVRQAASTPAGRKAIVNIIGAEAPAIRRLLGVNS